MLSMNRAIYTHVVLKPANLLQAGVHSGVRNLVRVRVTVFPAIVTCLCGVPMPQFKSERLEPAVNAAIANLITKNRHLAKRRAAERTSRVPTLAEPHLNT